MHIDDLDTPVAVIDLDRVEANIARLQRYCDAHGLALRPHVKTHKLPILAHKQLAAGAVGITCQKLGEAEIMAAAGIEDILISYNIIGKAKAERLARLARVAKMSVAVDNEVALDTVAEAATLARVPIGLLIEFESGMKRQGVLEPEQALALAQRANENAYLRFLGLMTYPSTPASADWIGRALRLFEAAEIPIQTVSGGGTPHVWKSHEIAGLTEIRVGTYSYHDRATVGAGAASLEDCALHVHAAVVSMPTRDRGVIDAGSKTLSSDLVIPEYGKGFGLVLEYPEAVIVKLSEEHGMVDFSACPARPAIGERMRLLPNHACVVTNLHDDIVAHRRGVVEAVWPLWARGKTR
jgi:D-serine deaminase-like pyridoxal phosphate-dependent protein